MVSLEKVKSAKKVVPRRWGVYGLPGIGKSSLPHRMGMPSPVYIDLEGGLSDIDVPAFPRCESLPDVMACIRELNEKDHPYKTVVLDSIDWLERLVWKRICSDKGVKSIAEINYGKGYSEAAAAIQYILEQLDKCRLRGMQVVVIAHAAISRFEDPEGDSYDRWVPKLHRTACDLFCEWCDELLFANYRTFTQQSDDGRGRKRSIGTGDGERFLYTQERPAFRAKSRLGLPFEISMNEKLTPYLGASKNGKP